MKDHNHIDSKTKKDAVRRLSIAAGHLEKVKKMLEENVYCPDVLHQSQAVQASLRKVDEIILDNHLKNCVLEDIKHGDKNKNQLAQEIMEVFKRKK